MTLQNSNIIQVDFSQDKKAKAMKHKPLQADDLKKWFIKYRLQNGLEGCYSLSPSEKADLLERLPRIYEQKGLNFFEFDSPTHRILIQSSQLIFFHFLFEPLASEFSLEKEGEDDDKDSYAVRVYFTNSPEPMIFQVDEDEPDPEDEGNKGEMDNFIYYALNAHKGEELLHFTDENGEAAFFYASNIALVEIPLHLLQKEKDNLEGESKSKSLV